ncbi:MAG: hypothetical protein ACON35_05625 [Candidatus Marinamargulisbacteria bacterium]
MNNNHKIDTKVLLENIKQLKEALAHINHFSAKENNYFSAKNQAIDVKMKINNKQTDAYTQLKSLGKVPDLPQNDAIDILNEHVQINHLKFLLIQDYLEDIYRRFETIGKNISTALNPIIEQLESIENQSNDINR